MFKRQRNLIGVLLPLALFGLCIFASEALAQKVRENFVYAPPSVSLTSDQTVLSLCEGQSGASSVRLNARATSPSGNPIRYTWTTSAGRINGDGAEVNWDLTGLRPGIYRAFLEVNTGSGDELCEAVATTAVRVHCPPAAILQPPTCPNLFITCPNRIEIDQPLTFSSAVTGSFGGVTPNYTWTVSEGRIIEGQGTPSIKVDTTGLAGQTIRATLAMGGYNVDCSASCAVSIPPPLPLCRKFDEFPDISRNDEKARLDNFAIELQNDPTSIGYVIVRPGPRGRSDTAQARSTRIVDYLVNSRGFESRRLITLVGPSRSGLMVELWICPQGVKPPNP